MTFKRYLLPFTLFIILTALAACSNDADLQNLEGEGSSSEQGQASDQTDGHSSEGDSSSKEDGSSAEDQQAKSDQSGSSDSSSDSKDSKSTSSSSDSNDSKDTSSSSDSSDSSSATSDSSSSNTENSSGSSTAETQSSSASSQLASGSIKEGDKSGQMDESSAKKYTVGDLNPQLIEALQSVFVVSIPKSELGVSKDANVILDMKDHKFELTYDQKLDGFVNLQVKPYSKEEIQKGTILVEG